MTKKVTQKLETTMSYLGIQDVTRKRRKISQRPGEWTGSIILYKRCGLVCHSFTEKMESGQRYLASVERQIRIVG